MVDALQLLSGSSSWMSQATGGETEQLFVFDNHLRYGIGLAKHNAQEPRPFRECSGTASKEKDAQARRPIWIRRGTGKPAPLEKRKVGTLRKKRGEQSWRQTLDVLQRPGIPAGLDTYASLLQWCSNRNALSAGKLVHAHILRSGYGGNQFLGNLLVDMYAKCGALMDARNVFMEMHRRNVFTWTIMIGAYARHGQGKEALRLFQQMELEKVMPSKVTFIHLLSACAGQAALNEGKQIHDRIVRMGVECDVIVGTAIVNMYGKCGNLEEARRIFDKMLYRNIVTWNTMVAAYAQHGKEEEALQLFEQMLLEGVIPDKITFISMTGACMSKAALAQGKMIHAHILDSGFEPDIVLGNALVSMYGKCGSLQDARSVFDRMSERNLVSWNAMIAGYAQHGEDKEALHLFQKMQLEGMIPDKATFLSVLSACTSQTTVAQMHACVVNSGFESDVVVGTALVNMYGKCGSLEDARKMFDKMPERNIVSWNTMIAAYAQQGHHRESFRLFQQMQFEGLIPDKVTFINILQTCASQAALVAGRQMHTHIVALGFESDVMIGNALVNMYGKCGSLEDAQRMFGKMSERNVISWTAMITAYAQHGKSKEAFLLFQQMQQEAVMPDIVTFVSILSACSHSGLVDDGNRYFLSMIQDHGINPTVEHFNCMIDLLGRLGRLDESENVINRMPCQPTTTSWMTLLGACRLHFDMERGRQAAKHSVELYPWDSAPYMLLSNIYNAAGWWDKAAEVRKLMDKGLKD